MTELNSKLDVVSERAGSAPPPIFKEGVLPVANTALPDYF